MATLLEFLKQTGARRLEAWQLKWNDIDFESRTANLTTREGGIPRIVRFNGKLAAMLNKLPRRQERIFTYKNADYMSKTFRKQRQRVAKSLANPRILRIHFHTLRHWRATMEYHRTRDIFHVMRFLRHRKIENTLIYVQLEQMLFTEGDEYFCKVASSVEEAKALIESGFEYVTDIGDHKLFRKRK